MFTDYSPITDDEVAHIHKTLRDMKALDTNLRVNTARRHKYESGPPISEEELQAYEEKCGICLPVDYRSFLNRVGLGAGPGCGLDGFGLEIDLNVWDLQKPFPFTEAVNYAPDTNDAPAGMICIAYYGGDSFVLLVVNGSTYGTIWEDRVTEYRFFPTGRTFGQWYAAWLGFLNEVAAPKLRADAVVDNVTPGMRRAELMALCGPSGGKCHRRDYRPADGLYALSFENLLSEFYMKPSAPDSKHGEDEIERINRSFISDSAWVFGSRPLSQKTGDTIWGG